MNEGFNINNYVYVKLTEHGARQLIRRGYIPGKFENGYTKIQLWELMNNLGDAIFNGSEQSILDNIIYFKAPIKTPLERDVKEAL